MCLKKYSFVLIAVVFTVGQLFSQCNTHVVFDEDVDNDILIDTVSWDCFEMREFAPWFTESYESYEVDLESLQDIPKDKSVQLTIYLATWCPDTQRELPRMKKLLDEMNAQWEVTLIALNRKKQLSEDRIPVDNITHVPCFIVYKDGEEVGRIIESPEISLEIDLRQLFK